MNHDFNINADAYSAMLNYLDKLSALEKVGTEKDSVFIKQDYWLQDTAVVENIEHRKGEWDINLVFAHCLFPLKLIKRKITTYACPKKAVLAAHFMRRQAAKDQRGTLQLKLSLFVTNYN
ncbi:MAG: hypothetical protein ACKO1T_09410 [Sediminibacterium sp.]